MREALRRAFPRAALLPPPNLYRRGGLHYRMLSITIGPFTKILRNLMIVAVTCCNSVHFTAKWAILRELEPEVSKFAKKPSLLLRPYSSMRSLQCRSVWRLSVSPRSDRSFANGAAASRPKASRGKILLRNRNFSEDSVRASARTLPGSRHCKQGGVMFKLAKLRANTRSGIVKTVRPFGISLTLGCRSWRACSCRRRREPWTRLLSPGGASSGRYHG